MNADSK